MGSRIRATAVSPALTAAVMAALTVAAEVPVAVGAAVAVAAGFLVLARMLDPPAAPAVVRFRRSTVACWAAASVAVGGARAAVPAAGAVTAAAVATVVRK